MKQSIQDKINNLKKLAETSPLKPSPKDKKSSITAGDSLAKVIKTQKEADAFMADLETAIKMAQSR